MKLQKPNSPLKNVNTEREYLHGAFLDVLMEFHRRQKEVDIEDGRTLITSLLQDYQQFEPEEVLAKPFCITVSQRTMWVEKLVTSYDLAGDMSSLVEHEGIRNALAVLAHVSDARIAKEGEQALADTLLPRFNTTKVIN